MIPSYFQGHRQVYLSAGKVLKACRKFNIDTIAGQPTSGVVIAVACFMRSIKWKKPISAMLLGKEGCPRRKHPNSPKFLGSENPHRIMIADDVVVSGDAILDAIEDVRNYIRDVCKDTKIIACMSEDFCDRGVERIRRKYPGIKLIKSLYRKDFKEI